MNHGVSGIAAPDGRTAQRVKDARESGSLSLQQLLRILPRASINGFGVTFGTRDEPPGPSWCEAFFLALSTVRSIHLHYVY